MTIHIRPRSIDDFCARLGISRSLFYVEAKKGKMPKVTKVGQRSIILERDEAAWAESKSANDATEAA